MKKKSQTQGYADLMLKSAKKEISPAIPSLNVALLRKVQNHILEEPRRLMMSLLAIKQGEQAPYYAKDLPKTFADCGTAACIAGWILILSRKKPFTVEDEDGDGAEKANDLLRIDSYKGDRLFHTAQWPTRFAGNYELAKTAKKRARVTSDRIDWFIKTGE